MIEEQKKTVPESSTGIDVEQSNAFSSTTIISNCGENSNSLLTLSLTDLLNVDDICDIIV